MVITAETYQIVQVTDVMTAVQPFTLTENWDPARLTLVGVDVFPPVGQVITSPGSLQVIGPAGPPEIVTVEKWFRVEPCDWITTTLEEYLVIDDAPPFEAKSVTINKLAPELHIASSYDPQVFAGSITSFTLSYSNTGGFENDVWISNTFPMTAPFIYADPLPSQVSPDRLSARWDIGGLATGNAGSIEVYVFISETVPTSSTITIWDGIFDHMDVLQEETEIEFHGNASFFPMTWEKYVSGIPWQPGISVTLETSQTLSIQEIIDPRGNPTGFSLVEEWNPEELDLQLTWTIEPISYTSYVLPSAPGTWVLAVPPGIDYGPLTITKEFHVEPCIWSETILWESLQVWGAGVRVHPVTINKRQSELWIDSFFDVSVYSGDEAQFVLAYGNEGGFETRAWISNTFPAEAPFLQSDPSPTIVGPEGRWVFWDIGPLMEGAGGRITVTVQIGSGLPPSTTIEIWDGIFNHGDELADETLTAYHVPPPTWDKWVNDKPWSLDLGTFVQTGDTITVTDVISTRSGMAIVEHWDSEHLSLTNYVTDPPQVGIIFSTPGFLSWEFPGGAPGQVTITKVFSIKPCTWTYTVLWEELWIEGVEWERRPVQIDKQPSALWIDSTYEPHVFAGQLVTFTLPYGNHGGLESYVMITSAFPAEAPFAWSDPPPTAVDPGGRWALWNVGVLASDEEKYITITVAIGENLPPHTMVHINTYIYDHVGFEHDQTEIAFERGPSIYLPSILLE
jgi:hypothetical protein